MTEDQKIRFRELALRFLDSFNPQPEKAIVIADAILSYDSYIDEKLPMRHSAHAFVLEATKLIEKGSPPREGIVGKWLNEWNERFGA